MNTKFFNSLSVIYLCLIIVIPGCREKHSYTVTGSVIDQDTKQPVAGAVVYRAIRRSSDAYCPLEGLTSVISGQDGRFSIDFSDKDYELPFSFPFVYAAKSGYAGSNYHSAKDAGDIGILELYHTATLNLRIRNDTISSLPGYLNRDDVYISLTGESNLDYPDFIGSKYWDLTPKVVKYCKGRKVDTTFLFYPLWGNLTYRVTFYSNKPLYGYNPAYFTSSVIIKPDSVAYLTLWY